MAVPVYWVTSRLAAIPAPVSRLGIWWVKRLGSTTGALRTTGSNPVARGILEFLRFSFLMPYRTSKSDQDWALRLALAAAYAVRNLGLPFFLPVVEYMGGNRCILITIPHLKLHYIITARGCQINLIGYGTMDRCCVHLHNRRSGILPEPVFHSIDFLQLYRQHTRQQLHLE